jgi:hypothetical protein
LIDYSVSVNTILSLRHFLSSSLINLSLQSSFVPSGIRCSNQLMTGILGLGSVWIS